MNKNPSYNFITGSCPPGDCFASVVLVVRSGFHVECEDEKHQDQRHCAFSTVSIFDFTIEIMFWVA